MHGDFKYNFIRYHLLEEALTGEITASDFKNYFPKKKVDDVSMNEIKDQLEHLRSEHFLMKTSDEEYKITEEGRKELADVVRAINNF